MLVGRFVASRLYTGSSDLIADPQCAFTAADKIVFAGFDISAPRRLGIHYCFNRKSGVYRTDLNGNLGIRTGRTRRPSRVNH